MKINCIIVDDEPFARKGLREYVEEIDFLELKAECSNALEANKILSSQKIDLIFLDIQMPMMTGIEFLKSMREKPMVIFTTAYSEYALQGYELDVLDYLVKPIPFERFLRACNKTLDFYSSRDIASTSSASEKPDYFFIRCDNQYEKIEFRDLLFAQAMENYVILQTREKRFVSYMTFKSAEEYLPADKFVKVHKSYIVAIDNIDNITGNEIKIGTFTIPISRNQKNEAMERILKDKFLKR